MELSDFSLELGVLTGLVVALGLSQILPAYSFLATLAGGGVAAYLHARNYKQGALAGLLTGLSMALMIYLEMQRITMPTGEIVSSIVVYSSSNTSTGLYMFAAAYTVISSTLAGLVTGKLIYSDEFSFHVVDTAPGR